MKTLNIHAFKDLSPAQIPQLATLCIIINIKTFAIECIIYSKSCIDQSHKVSNIKRKLKLQNIFFSQLYKVEIRNHKLCRLKKFQTI